MPLSLRQRIGPYVAYVVYIFNIYMRPNRKRPHVLSLDATIDLIKEKNLSAIRFGDGEMSLITNQDLAFQKTNKDLSEKMAHILQTQDDKLLICIPGIWENINGFSKRSFWFSLHHLFRYDHAWKNILSSNKMYGDAFITRPYLNYKDKSVSERIFPKIISLWNEADVVLIEGSKSRLGVGNDLFNNVKSLGRILCPPANAFSKYEAIKSEALKISKNKLILLSLGPTAKVLAYDLFLLGYRVLDIGHIDMEYEMFLRKESGIVKVKYKYFNEIDERNPEECTDEKYLNQILAYIE
ncbi:MAG: SP_1767 family glycosyltransferase [Patescibacteria group bacterium]